MSGWLGPTMLTVGYSAAGGLLSAALVLLWNQHRQNR